MEIYGNYQGRRICVGKLRDGVFCKRVKSYQKLYKLDSYGFDKDYVDQLKNFGCHRIELLETNTNILYVIDFQRFCDLAIPKSLGKFGIRYYLPLRYWNKIPGRSLANTGG